MRTERNGDSVGLADDDRLAKNSEGELLVASGLGVFVGLVVAAGIFAVSLVAAVFFRRGGRPWVMPQRSTCCSPSLRFQAGAFRFGRTMLGKNLASSNNMSYIVIEHSCTCRSVRRTSDTSATGLAYSPGCGRSSAYGRAGTGSLERWRSSTSSRRL